MAKFNIKITYTLEFSADDQIPASLYENALKNAESKKELIDLLFALSKSELQHSSCNLQLYDSGKLVIHENI